MAKYRESLSVSGAKNPIGKKILDLCNEKGISVTELSMRAGLAKDHVRQYILNESCNCTIAFLMKVARALDIRVGDLYDYLDEESIRYQLDNYDTKKRRDK